MKHAALLALEDGTFFHGRSIGADGLTVGELVFNTAITGYQEILTDPSYCRQIVTLTQPHIGNVGVNEADRESDRIHIAGLVIRDLALQMSSWRARKPLEAYLKEQNIVAISDIDTRYLTRILRDGGVQNACIVAGADIDAAQALRQAREFPGLRGMDLARVVTTGEKYDWRQGIWTLAGGLPEVRSKTNRELHVIAYDFGVKHNILRILSQSGCRLTVVPATTAANEVLASNPDGVFLSNGPGDPDPCAYAIVAIQEILARGIPTFGICLGYQLLALALGAQTVKMKCGHHGANHPVQDLSDGRVMITSQNHGFAVDEKSLPGELRATHRSLFDGTLQGIHHTDMPAFGFQGHPEASPGPHDLIPLFQHFIELMQNGSASGQDKQCG